MGREFCDLRQWRGYLCDGCRLYSGGSSARTGDPGDDARRCWKSRKWANFNAIRVWGGGYYPEDWFYDLCDELGFVVWQDFMFACAVYDLTPEFEANIRAEFIDNVKRLRHHASLGLWCGNNEMEEFVYAKNSWLTKAAGGAGLLSDV